MKTFTTTEVRHNTAEIIKECLQGPVQITQYNRPVAAVLSWEDYERLTDTFEIILNPDTFSVVRRGLFDYYAGRMTPWEEIRDDLNLQKD